MNIICVLDVYGHRYWVSESDLQAENKILIPIYIKKGGVFTRRCNVVAGNDNQNMLHKDNIKSILATK